jgi:predicted ATPase/DNA-binding SARP family transcriptional activator
MRPDPPRLIVDVLGPLRVTAADGDDLTPSGTLQRRLLALLVLHRGNVVTADTAIDALWPRGLPADPGAALQNHMSRLRRELPADMITSTGEGYRLDPYAVDVDVDRLAAYVADGVDPAGAEEILARWHGTAYPDLAECDAALTEAARLEELRTRAAEVRAQLRLAAGHTDGLVAELTALAAAHPLRERPRSLLLDALAATGRRAEALRVYDDFRRLLSDELGIEPSPALAAQHAALLAGPTPAPGWAPATRLPHPATSLIGRRELVAEVIDRLTRERLVTLVGPGGVGKTRLAVELGHRLLDADPARPVVLCELATGDAATAVEVVAAALGVDGRPGVPLPDRIAEVLRPTAAVLLFDNCEHVLDQAAALAEHLLTRCPELRIVATSRERLRVAGEQVRPVPTLAAGDIEAPAVQLFLERARAVWPGFEPDAGQLATIAAIVGRLDGLPLAIELAAARLHTHDVDEVAAGLDDRFALLTVGQRTSTRHGSLGAAVAWSFGLLDPDLQESFAGLSSFATAFTATDAAAVAGTDVTTATARLAQLVERSLVIRAPERRYMLLETLRAFGAEQLRAAGRAARVAERHAEYQVEWLDAANRRLLEPGSGALAEIEVALPELRSAFGWALDNGRVDLAGRLAVQMLDFGFFRLRPDVLAWTERVIAADPDDSSALATSVWCVASYAAWMAGDLDECAARSHRACVIAEQHGGPLPTDVLQAEASVALFRGELDAAAEQYHAASLRANLHDPARPIVSGASEVLALGYAGRDAIAAERIDALVARVPPDTCYAAYVWYCAGEAAMAVNPEQARAHFTRALEIAERTHTSFVIGTAGASKASLDARHGDPAQAAADYRRLILHWRRAGMWSTQWTMLRSIAGLLARLGKYHDAAVLEGAIRATLAGHRIFGADEVALNELSRALERAMGPASYADAVRTGATLDGDAAAEHALAAL